MQRFLQHNPPLATIFMLTEKQKKELIGIARETLKACLSGAEPPSTEKEDPVLQEKRGLFVTLKKDGSLRGCIGCIEALEPLAEGVRRIAVQSATGDPRFPPLSYDELEDVKIEISVLTVPKKVGSADEVVLGRDGVILKKGYKKGVFLPQVADETGWSKEDFLNNLCTHKAGLPEYSWREPDTEIYTFQAEIVSED